MLVVSDIVDARLQNKPIGQVPSSDFESVLRDIVERLFALKGVEYSKTQAGLIQDEVGYLAAHSYPSLTVPELKMALEAGLSGEFRGVGNTLSVANCIGWVRTYFNCDERRTAVEMIANMRHNNTSELSVEEINKRNKEVELHEPDKAYQRYLAEGRSILFAGYAAIVYDSLVKHGKMNPSEATIMDAKRQAELSMRKASGFNKAMRGANTPLLELYVKQELLYRYFESLKNRQVKQISIV